MKVVLISSSGLVLPCIKKFCLLLKMMNFYGVSITKLLRVCICLSALLETDLEETFFRPYQISALEISYICLCNTSLLLDICTEIAYFSKLLGANSKQADKLKFNHTYCTMAL